MGDMLRIGIVGAGDVVREKHIPGFRALPGVRAVGDVRVYIMCV